jgi:hypothetical protein
VERNNHSSRSPKRTFGDSDLEAEGERDGSVEGRRVRRKPVSNTSNLSSASPTSNLAPPPSSPDAPPVVDEDAEGDYDDEDDEDRSVLELLAGPSADEGFTSDSSLSPPPPDPNELAPARRTNSQFLHPYSQVSMATTPPSSAPPSSRPSPAPFEGLSQETTSVFDEERQRTSGPATGIRLTRRQRRNMGLPKHGNGSGRASPNTSTVIVIPGGRHPSRLAMKAAQERQRLSAASDQTAVFDGDGETFQHEWEKNGAGRKDSRGFVILNI